MLRNIPILVQLEWKKFIRFAAFILMALSLALRLCRRAPSSRNRGPLPRPKMPAGAIFTAMQAPDDRSLLSILGPPDELGTI